MDLLGFLTQVRQPKKLPCTKIRLFVFGTQQSWQQSFFPAIKPQRLPEKQKRFQFNAKRAVRAQASGFNACRIAPYQISPFSKVGTSQNTTKFATHVNSLLIFLHVRGAMAEKYF